MHSSNNSSSSNNHTDALKGRIVKSLCINQSIYSPVVRWVDLR